MHGTNDTTVPLEMAMQLKEKSVTGELKIIENADHTFGGKHPWVDEQLPLFTQEAIKASVAFLKEQ